MESRSEARSDLSVKRERNLVCFLRKRTSRCDVRDRTRANMCPAAAMTTTTTTTTTTTMGTSLSVLILVNDEKRFFPNSIVPNLNVVDRVALPFHRFDLPTPHTNTRDSFLDPPRAFNPVLSLRFLRMHFSFLSALKATPRLHRGRELRRNIVQR